MRVMFDDALIRDRVGSRLDRGTLGKSAMPGTTATVQRPRFEIGCHIKRYSPRFFAEVPPLQIQHEQIRKRPGTADQYLILLRLVIEYEVAVIRNSR